MCIQTSFWGYEKLNQLICDRVDHFCFLLDIIETEMALQSTLIFAWFDTCLIYLIKQR